MIRQIKAIPKALSNSVRFFGVDAVNFANSGHPGICLDAAPMITELFTRHLKATAANSKWINRDRFVMSAGHGSALLYSILFHMGYNISLKDLKNFRQLDSNTPGHPEFNHTDGVDATSGPLGQGVAQAVGMAMAERYLSEKFNKDDYEIFDHYTYALICDGDLQEGISYEAMSLAGHLGLEKLIFLYDSNDYQLDGAVEDAYSDNLKSRCESQGWNYIPVSQGEDTAAIGRAILKAKKQSLPTMIEIKTTLGIGTSMADTADTHGAPIGKEERDAAAKYFKYEQPPFVIQEDAKRTFSNIIDSKKIAYEEWSNMFASYKKQFPNEYASLNKLINNSIEIDLIEHIKTKLGSSEATRNHSPEIIKALTSLHPAFIGGSADLKKSTKVSGIGEFLNSKGTNINYGVREFAMAAISNGIALHGMIKPYASTFFIFSDYAKPAIRLSALQNLPVTYIFTHDSIMVGEDGPTHEPIEQLTSLRSIPNHNVIRPADKKETILAYQEAINSKKTPTSIVLTRQNVENVSKVSKTSFKKGAYIIKEASKSKPDLTIVATGSEVSSVLGALKDMPKSKSNKIAVVSMPSTFYFDQQNKEYQNKIIPDRNKTLFIELSDGAFGYKYAQHVYSLFNQFGYSAPGEDVLKKMKFSKDDIIKVIEKLLKG